MNARIDIHSHLLPGIDDGCTSVEESLQCARALVGAGYAQAVCTPHFWTSLPGNTVKDVARRTRELQQHVDAAAIPLRLWPGGEINIRPEYIGSPADQIPTYAGAGRHVLIDLWADRLPDFFRPAVDWLQGLGLTVVLAHPERMRAVQDQPELADAFADWGLLLQGNLQCLSDPPEAPTRITVERFLREDRYFVLGSDTHTPKTQGMRLAGLIRAVALVGEAAVEKLTVTNPATLLAV